MKNLKKSIAKKAAKVVLGTVRMSNGTASIFEIGRASCRERV